MELQLGLSLPLHNLAIHCTNKRKREFQDSPTAKNQLPPTTLPLLSWNDNPKDEDDPHNPRGTHFCTVNIHKKEEEKKEAVGWPPIESWRKKAVQRPPEAPERAENDRRLPVPAETEINKLQNNGGPTNSLFVKVKMEGVAIARKLDLTLYHSHHSLKTALIPMFAPFVILADQAMDIDGWDFTLIYEDKDGDWLLAQDLPWNSFIESVQRLKILVRKTNKEY